MFKKLEKVDYSIIYEIADDQTKSRKVIDLMKLLRVKKFKMPGLKSKIVPIIKAMNHFIVTVWDLDITLTTKIKQTETKGEFQICYFKENHSENIDELVWEYLNANLIE